MGAEPPFSFLSVLISSYSNFSLTVQMVISHPHLCLSCPYSKWLPSTPFEIALAMVMLSLACRVKVGFSRILRFASWQTNAQSRLPEVLKLLVAGTYVNTSCHMATITPTILPFYEAAEALGPVNTLGGQAPRIEYSTFPRLTKQDCRSEVSDSWKHSVDRPADSVWHIPTCLSEKHSLCSGISDWLPCICSPRE